ncbi:MAG: restriction endonuclease subunit S [Anaerolineaceae bacterium]|nr:restriction endonuclease subunit S [Anaerolineaceae bacterium]
MKKTSTILLLRDIGILKSGSTPSKSIESYWDGDFPWITAKDLKVPIIQNSIDRLSKEGALHSRITPKNSLLILVRGMTLFKDVPVCLAGRDVAFNQDIKAFVPSEGIDPRYLLYFFLSRKHKLLGLVDAAGHGTGRLDTDLLKQFPIVLPPFPEQKAIADLLSTWDEAIEKTERLIRAKEKRFKWLLRELISEQRNSQKGTEWKKVKLGEVCKITKGKQLNVAHMKEDGTYYALNGGIKPSGRTDDWNTEAGTITISEGGNSCGYVNYNIERFWSGGHCYSLLNLHPSVNSHYLFFYLKMSEPKLMKLRVGSGLPNIQKKDVDRFKTLLPTLPEQQQIVSALSTAQQEIDLLKQLAEKYKTQKRGLMQKMLTGEWRIKPEIVNQYMEA